jgi:putative iron-regulated protein
MQNAIIAFVDNPSQLSLDAAKQAWLDAREPYGQSEIFRFVDGPIDNPADGPEGLLNAWPMDEAYVDYVDGNATSGIINDLTNYPTIDAASLLSANEFGSETNISLGYHAIEFLLWGQDLSAATAGVRPYTDYVLGGTSTNQDRRGEYLKLCADILLQGLQQVKNEWDPNVSNNYRVTWLALDNDIALRKMFNSIRAMAGDELSGERMFTAYDNMDQEDEHSCFSDNTHRDIILNAQGIENLYLGTYTDVNSAVVSGYSLSDLVAQVDAANNTQMIADLDDAKTKISLMYIPFDQAIVLPAERPKVIDAVNALIQEGNTITSIAASFDIVF